MLKSVLFFGIAATLTPACYAAAQARFSDPLLRTVTDYSKAAYARDFEHAYRLLALKSRQAKEPAAYVNESDAFSGFTLQVAKQLAGLIEVTPIEKVIDGDNARVTVKLSFPDANLLSADLLDWDQARLNALSTKEQNDLLKRLDRRRAEGKIPMAQGTENFELHREQNEWRVFREWASGLRLELTTSVPPAAPFEAEPVPKEIVLQPGEPFTVAVRLRNRSNREVWARIAHKVEPDVMAKHMGLADCGSFVPLRLAPGETKESKSTYLLWTDVPAGLKQFTLLYEFEHDPH